MLRYYCFLGLRSLKRNPILTGLMVLTLAIGVAASVSTLTILHVMSMDPIPQKSDRLFAPILDNGPLETYTPGDPPHDHQLTYRDATNLLASNQGERRTALYPVGGAIEPARKDLDAMEEEGLAATHDFFGMFDTPFLYGRAWSEKEDTAAADVVVLSRNLSEKLYGNTNPVGQRVKMLDFEFQVIGVLDTWQLKPRFYHHDGRDKGRENAYGKEHAFLLPFSSAINHGIGSHGGMSCLSRPSAPGWQGFLYSECTWFHFWFELKSSRQRADLQSYLDHYTDEQRKSGRFLRHAKNEIFDVKQWLERMKLISSDSKLSAWLAFGFLLLCLVNVIGLLLAKFSARATEIGVRRALGASRRQIFTQFLVESSFIGMVGGVAGLLLAFGGLALIALQSRHLAVVAHMDWTMLAITFLMSITAAILAGLLPTWRACNVTPAIQLKSQ